VGYKGDGVNCVPMPGLMLNLETGPSLKEVQSLENKLLALKTQKLQRREHAQGQQIAMLKQRLEQLEKMTESLVKNSAAETAQLKKVLSSSRKRAT
jgi:DNA-binding transcriptional MerR regulator